MYMTSSKVMCDDTYFNKSWCIVAQGMFASDTAITYAALMLLQRLKAQLPSAHGSSRHQLFISAYVTSKVMCDDTYSNKSWFIVTQGMFSCIIIHLYDILFEEWSVSNFMLLRNG
jgi:hypothetical protein